MITKLFRVFALLLIVFLLGNCETVSNTLIESPKVDFKELKINSFSMEGVEFVATLNAENNNLLDLTVDQIDYQMMIANKPLFSGTTKTPVNLKSKQINTVEIPFAIKFKDAKAAFEEIVLNHNNNYLFQGTTHIGIFKVPFSNKGTLNLPKVKF